MEGTSCNSQADITEDSQEDNISDHPIVPTIQALDGMGYASHYRQSSNEEYVVNEDGDLINEDHDYEYDSSSSGHVLRFSHELM